MPWWGWLIVGVLALGCCGGLYLLRLILHMFDGW